MTSMKTPDLIVYLKDKWPQVAAAYSPQTLAELAAAYKEQQRDYHSTSHIIDLLQKLETYRAHAKRPDLIAHAILWHDAVYATNETIDGVVTHRKDALNVEDSAAWFERTEVKLSPEDRAEVAAMVRATSGHSLGDLSPSDPRYNDRALFLDLDLSVLALPADDFKHNTQRIRVEYPHTTEREFCLGRAAFFDDYGKKERLYFHPVTAALFDAPARANMRRAAIDLRARAAQLPAPTGAQPA